MILEELLTENPRRILYHYTSIAGAWEILNSGQFQLSSTTGNQSEKNYAPRGYPFFLSTTRTKLGDYHHFVGNGAVMFVLDGDLIASRYLVKPIDYWERSWQHSPGRSRESEDRVFSRKPSMPISSIMSVHVLLKEQDVGMSQSARTRKILIAAKKQGIPAYLYNDTEAWRLQDRRRAIPPSEAKELLRGAAQLRKYIDIPRGVPGRKSRSTLLTWIELIKKPKNSELSPEAKKILYNIRYSYGGSMVQSLENDLFNSKKPGNSEYALSVRLTDYMNRNNMELGDLLNMLKTKWEGVNT